MTSGAIKIYKVVLLFLFWFDLNNVPRKGRSLRNGTPSSEFCDSVVVIPPINATPPSLIKSLVRSCFVEIAGGFPVPGVSLLTATSSKCFHRQ